jgi:hypothetical protein
VGGHDRRRRLVCHRRVSDAEPEADIIEAHVSMSSAQTVSSRCEVMASARQCERLTPSAGAPAVASLGAITPAVGQWASQVQLGGGVG